MEFPITKDRLKNYRANEAVEAETKLRLAAEIRNICEGVELTVLSTTVDRYVYHINYSSVHGPPCQLSIDRVSFLERLLEELKKLFPDSKIMPDPLTRYIIIDWV
jgi:hypothetical protein